MATTEYTYRINGTLNTSDGVLANMEKLANSAATWISFDMFTGKWDVVINKAESVSATFDDSNIIGSIQLNILGLKEMYNAVEVQFPHSDLNGQKDYIRISIPSEDRLPGEPDNCLTINYDLLSDPVQAQFLGLVELKQSRLDKTIVFRADYSKINIPAGAVISVTNTTFGWTAKEFRIVTVKEISDNDALQTEITAIEYDANTYSTDDLYRYIRSNASGIVTFGAIGQPDAPQVTKFEGISRPGILIETDVPGGLVNGMEFWLTRDTTISSDDLRNYNLIGTIYGTGGENLTQGDTVELDYDTLDTGNLYVKTRGINGDITGPYSTPSGLINFNAKQVTDAIGANTAINDNAGNPIGGLLTANALMALLGGLMNGNTASGGSSIFGQLFGMFSATGAPLGGVTVSAAAAAQGLSINNLTGGAYQIDYGGPVVNINATDVILRWTFLSGSDLDIRCRMVVPDLGQNTVDNYLGYTGGSGQFPATSTRYWPTTGTPILEWGGDNTGTGVEAVRIDIDQVVAAYPSEEIIVVECRGNWWTTPSPDPVKLAATLYDGGTTTRTGFDFTNTGATKTRNLSGVSVYIDSWNGAGTTPPSDAAGQTTLGDLMGYFIYDIANGAGRFVNTLY